MVLLVTQQQEAQDEDSPTVHKVQPPGHGTPTADLRNVHDAPELLAVAACDLWRHPCQLLLNVLQCAQGSA